MKQIAGLIGDLADLFGSKVAQYVSDPFTQQIIESVSRVNSNDYKVAANYCKTAIQKILR